ncbi:hypothetical protein M378DRAFT_596611 [Amanita muscaria Koide BX008]|uniref:Uncharacterized protein n=1 Tax=Amanita muscaria (strain Koide BX008) TaxID=946122 RepID=A0A0C2SNA4_AMAMK|nr:hypothetical protein M378DRAFT_596611 [Amanita muscaria Koide BX008]
MVGKLAFSKANPRNARPILVKRAALSHPLFELKNPHQTYLLRVHFGTKQRKRCKSFSLFDHRTAVRLPGAPLREERVRNIPRFYTLLQIPKAAIRTDL